MHALGSWPFCFVWAEPGCRKNRRAELRWKLKSAKCWQTHRRLQDAPRAIPTTTSTGSWLGVSSSAGLRHQRILSGVVLLAALLPLIDIGRYGIFSTKLFVSEANFAAAIEILRLLPFPLRLPGARQQSSCS